MSLVQRRSAATNVHGSATPVPAGLLFRLIKHLQSQDPYLMGFICLNEYLRVGMKNCASAYSDLNETKRSPNSLLISAFQKLYLYPPHGRLTWPNPREELIILFSNHIRFNHLAQRTNGANVPCHISPRLPPTISLTSFLASTSTFVACRWWSIRSFQAVSWTP